MKNHKKGLTFSGAVAITLFTLTIGIQENSLAMTVPGHEIAPGAPEPIKAKPGNDSSKPEQAPTTPQAEDKTPCSDEPTKKPE